MRCDECGKSIDLNVTDAYHTVKEKDRKRNMCIDCCFRLIDEYDLKETCNRCLNFSKESNFCKKLKKEIYLALEINSLRKYYLADYCEYYATNELRWKCKECGHIIVGPEEPEECPVCEPSACTEEFGPMTFVGGSADLGTVEYNRAKTDYMSPAFGFLVLKTRCIEFKTTEDSMRKTQIRIPMEKVRDVGFKTGKDITFLRYVLLGSWAFLLKKRRQFLELTYEDSSGIFKHLFFDFDCDREIALELMNLANVMRKRYQTLDKVTHLDEY